MNGMLRAGISDGIEPVLVLCDNAIAVVSPFQMTVPVVQVTAALAGQENPDGPVDISVVSSGF